LNSPASEILSWGRVIRTSASVDEVLWRSEMPKGLPNRAFLPIGLGRSYGDCCLNQEGVLFETTKLNRLINFDSKSGIITCEAGASLAQILDFSVPRGWFIPVTPGTKEVTIGGAIANDVHGKNHHVSGTFGRFVPELELLRSSGEKLICSASTNSSLYSATIAGVGLTGLILSAKIQLKKISSAFLICENIPFRDLDEFLDLSPEASRKYEYSVAWLDCASKGKNFGRGILMCGMHEEKDSGQKQQKSKDGVSIPFEMPAWFLNPFLIKRFNELYFYMKAKKDGEFVSHFDPFFYPLDVAKNWNKLYGKAGFFQYQCVVPTDNKNAALKGLMKLVKEADFSSYLAVLKEFGSIHSPGMMSFPRPGMTLCLDFPNKGKDMLRFLDRLNSYAVDCGGAIYPAKDATMTSEHYKKSYSHIEDFKKLIDPKFSSSFWRRVAA